MDEVGEIPNCEAVWTTDWGIFGANEVVFGYPSGITGQEDVTFGFPQLYQRSHIVSFGLYFLGSSGMLTDAI